MAPPGKIGILVGGKIKYVERPGYVAEKPVKAPRAKAEKGRPPKFDPKYLTAARELRDRCMEQVNDPMRLAIASGGKYDVSRTLTSMSSVESSVADEGRAMLDARAATPVPLLIAG